MFIDYQLPLCSEDLISASEAKSGGLMGKVEFQKYPKAELND